MVTSHQNTKPVEEDQLLKRFKKNNLPPNSIIRFNEEAGVRLSEELYNIDKVRWGFSTFGFRTLFAIAQSIDKSTWYNDVFIKQDAMFQYLGISKSGQRYDILAKALSEVRSATFNRRNEKTKKWDVFGFVTNADFTEGGNFVHIIIDEKSKPLLFELKQFVQIQPKIYLSLKDEYQNWLYPMLKLRVGGRADHFCRWEMSIDDIATALQLDKKTPNKGEKTRLGAYDHRNKDRIGNILKYVIGIRISEEAKQENRLAAIEKREPKEIPWDYTTSREGLPNGTLYTISNETDIRVRACAMKVGRAYGKVIFYIDLKDESLSSYQQEQEYVKVIQAADHDMGKRQRDNGGEANLAQIIAENAPFATATKPAKPIYTGKQLLDWCKKAGITDVRTIAQAAAFTNKKKIGKDQYQ